jgi:hypothetical protein
MPRKRTRVPTSKDAFLVANAGDDLAVVVRGHIVCEALLLHIIIAKSRPGLTFDTLNLTERADVAIALGALPYEDRAPFQHLNTLRNRFAHDLDSKLTQEDAKRLRSSFSPRLRALLDSFLGGSPERPLTARTEVAACLVVMQVWLDAQLKKAMPTPMSTE